MESLIEKLFVPCRLKIKPQHELRPDEPYQFNSRCRSRYRRKSISLFLCMWLRNDRGCAEREDPALGKVWVSPLSSVYLDPQEPPCLKSGESESALVTQVSHRCESELS